eukprot:c45607_g1_i1 orf=3-167(-)
MDESFQFSMPLCCFILSSLVGTCHSYQSLLLPSYMSSLENHLFMVLDFCILTING